MKGSARLWMSSCVLMSILGCSDSGTNPGTTVPGGPEGLLVEPSAYCLGTSQTADSLTVYSLAGKTLEWTTLHLPPGMSGVPDTFSVPPQTGLLFDWEWLLSATPQLDSIVAETRPIGQPDSIGSFRVVIPVTRVAEDYVDIEPPPSAMWILPEDDQRFSPGEIIPLVWTRVSDCSGIANYQIQISDTPAFNTILCCDGKLTATSDGLLVDPTDIGRAYCRILVQDKAGLVSVGETLTWVVE